jgi:hypothetical protein
MLKSTELTADEDFIANFDRVNHGRSTGTNSDGELLMPALIPGATYRFHQFAGYGTAVVERNSSPSLASITTWATSSCDQKNELTLDLHPWQ